MNACNEPGCAGNSSALPIDLLSDAEEAGAVRYGALCLAPLCGERRNAAAGHGYCRRHQANFERYGHWQTRAEKTREDLLEAALWLADDYDAANALARAAVEFAGVRCAGGATAERRRQAPGLCVAALDTDSGVALIDAALAYADCDTSASGDVTFERALNNLECAAVSFFRALPVTVNQPSNSSVQEAA